MTTETYILPSYWASALINCDLSGLSHEDEKEMDKFIANNKEDGHYFSCVGCSDESYFSYRNDATNLGGDVLEYTFDISPIN